MKSQSSTSKYYQNKKDSNDFGFSLKEEQEDPMLKFLELKNRKDLQENEMNTSQQNRQFPYKKRTFSDIYNQEEKSMLYLPNKNYYEEKKKKMYNPFFDEKSFFSKINGRNEENKEEEEKNGSKKIDNINSNINNKNNSNNNNLNSNDKSNINNKDKENQKKIMEEFSCIENILKEEQIYFLNDNHHVSQMSKPFKTLPENKTNYVIAKRVKFPPQVYQTFPEDDDSNNESFAIVYPLLNCIIFVKKTNLIFFNYINEKTYNYNDLPKPIKKIHITIPKPGIFISDVKYILICVLDKEIHLLSIYYNEEEELPIIRKTDFIFGFEETVIDLVSTANHRIFMSTSKNKIYELNYSNNNKDGYFNFNFFGSRNSITAINKERPAFFGLFADLKFFFKKSIEIIHKLKVDDSRKILYAIKYTMPKNENVINLDKVLESSILIFDLGMDGKSFNKIEEISHEDLDDPSYNFGYNNYNYNNYQFGGNLDEDNNFINRNNIIIDITPLNRDKFSEYHLVVLKRNGQKIFLKFNTIIDDTEVPHQNEILSLNSSAFCRERLTDRFISVFMDIPIEPINNIMNNSNNNSNFNINDMSNININGLVLFDLIIYYPFSTFAYYSSNNNYILTVVDDDLSHLAKEQNKRYSHTRNNLSQINQILFKSTNNLKRLYSIIKLSDYNIDDCCGLGHLLKNSPNGVYLLDNMSYIDDGYICQYNCMHEYARQLFYSPDEIGLLFSDEFVIYKKLRPIDDLIEVMQRKQSLGENSKIYNNMNGTFIEGINNNNIYINNNINDSMIGYHPKSVDDNNNRKSQIMILSSGSLLSRALNINPFQKERKRILYDNYHEFINKHGYIETVVMLMNIITNHNFYYYSKFLKDFNSNNEGNMTMLNSYLTKFTGNKAKNDNALMNLGQDYLLKLFFCAGEELDYYIKQYKEVLTDLKKLSSEKNLFNQNNNINSFNNLNFNFMNNNNDLLKFDNYKVNMIYKPNQSSFFDGKNYLSKGLLLFLSRVVRLCWEEKLFIKTKLYSDENNYEFTIKNNLTQNQIMFIKNLLLKFINSLKQIKKELLQNISELSNKFIQLKNLIEGMNSFFSLNNNTIINEVILKLNSDEEKKTIHEHQKNVLQIFTSFNFDKFSTDFDIIMKIAQRLYEMFTFIDIIYRTEILNEIKKRNAYEVFDYKVKDIYKGEVDNNFITKNLVQIIFEIYLNEKNLNYADVKVDDIISKCPLIVDKKEIDSIEGKIILKYCNSTYLNDVDKIKFVQDAIEKIKLNLTSVNIEEVVNYLSKFQDLQNIIQLCLKKGKIIQSLIQNNNSQNFILNNNYQPISLFNLNNRNKNENNSLFNKDINLIEFDKCINIVLTILNYIHNSIINETFEKYIEKISSKGNRFFYPIYIGNLLCGKTYEDLIQMEKIILTMSLDEDYDFIHDNIFEFLKANNLEDRIQEINVPSVEKYLNNKINITRRSPQSLYSMYNFYFRNKNYTAATKILATLINYNNPSSNLNLSMDGENQQNFPLYVSLYDRITYVNSMLKTLDYEIQDAEYLYNNENRNEKIEAAKNLREKMINIKNILYIQYELRAQILNYINNYNQTYNINNNNNNDNNLIINDEIKGYHEAEVLLDRQIYPINSLYYDFAKKFLIFDSCISIFFHLKFTLINKMNIDPREIKNSYIDYFQIIDRNNSEQNWPAINFDRLKKIFIVLIKEKTQYQSFSDMLLKNNMRNKYHDLIPVKLIISIIEYMNKKFIFNNKKFDSGDEYLMKIKQDYKEPDNPFWFILFLKNQIELPLCYIFNNYFIIYLSLLKIHNPNENQNLNQIQNYLKFDDKASRSISALSDQTSLNLENYGELFDGNLSGIPSEEFKRTKDSVSYCQFLLMGIIKLWCNKISYMIEENWKFSHGLKKNKDEYDLKMFCREIKNSNSNRLIKVNQDSNEQIIKFKLLYSEEKMTILKKYFEEINEELLLTIQNINTYNGIEDKNININNNNKISINNLYFSEVKDSKSFGKNFENKEKSAISINPFLSEDRSFGLGLFKNFLGK